MGFVNSCMAENWHGQSRFGRRDNLDIFSVQAPPFRNAVPKPCVPVVGVTLKMVYPAALRAPHHCRQIESDYPAGEPADPAAFHTDEMIVTGVNGPDDGPFGQGHLGRESGHCSTGAGGAGVAPQCLRQIQMLNGLLQRIPLQRGFLKQDCGEALDFCSCCRDDVSGAGICIHEPLMDGSCQHWPQAQDACFHVLVEKE